MRREIHSPRMALGRQIATCLAVVATALAFTACGEDSSDGSKIPKDTADALIEELEEVENNIDEGDCEGDSSTAPTALADVRAQVDAAEGIDPELVADIQELLDRLEDQVNDFCAEQEDGDDEESTTSSTTTTTTSTDTSDEEETTTSTDEDDEEETKETTTEEPEVEPEPEPPEPEPTPPGNGPDGEGPPGQDGGFETDDGGFAPERGNSAPNGGQG